tara:strand:+ start:1868 stop:2086 length:219 start_codon:yes stop_codon:yes gene_type:complete
MSEEYKFAHLEYKTALQRLKKANTIEELSRLDRSFERVYKAGFLTVNEYSRLVTKLADKEVKLELKAWEVDQ